MATSRKLQLVLACLLVAGIAGCTGDGGDPGERTAADPCELLTATELDAVLAGREPEAAGRLVATRRFVTLDQPPPDDAPVATDVCEFNQVHERGDAVERALEIRFTTNQRYLSNADQSHPIEDLGDEAYYSGWGTSSNIIARRGDLLLLVKLTTVNRRRQPDPPGPLVTATRQALERLPDHAEVPGLAAEGPCADIDLNAVAAALGRRIGYSRSRSTDDQDRCSFTGARGGGARLTLTKHPDGRKATAIQRGAAKVDAPGVDAYWYLGEVLVYDNGQELSIQAPTAVPVPDAKLTPGLIKLTGAAAKAYRLRQSTPSPGTGTEGTDPCALLTPEQAGWSDLSSHEPAELRVVSRAVWSYGDNVPVDTCGYERYRTVAGERPDLEVGIAAGHYDPVAEDDNFPKDPQPVDGLGDRAYFVYDSDEGWLVVERGQVQLTLHGRLSYQDENATVRAAYVRAARAALDRLPAEVEVAATVTDPACSEIGGAVARAVNGELRYTRGVASHFAASCTYTMANGMVVQVGVERNLSADDLKEAGERTTWWSHQGALIQVVGDGSMLTVSVHEPGKRAFPSDLGPDDVALAKAVRPLLS